MTESPQQGQGQDTSSGEATPMQASSQEQRLGEHAEPQGREKPPVSYDRFYQVNQKAKDLEQRLQEIESEKEREAEERARKQGEFQSLADRYKKQADTEKQKRLEIESSWTRERRLNVWSRASHGVIKPEATEDAFYMLGEEDFKTIDDTDEAAMKRLAEQLVERKPYMSDGPRGAGSGGSAVPVLGNPHSPTGRNSGGSSNPNMTSTGRLILKRANRRPQWK